MHKDEAVYIGTAGWSIPKAVADRFPTQGSGLSRYAAVFNAVEVNSTFYRRHRTTTFERWADSVPDHFLFSVKIPKEITHDRQLKNVDQAFNDFLQDVSPLQKKLGPLLCQLPPSLIFQEQDVAMAFSAMRLCYQGPLAVEARHISWASRQAASLLDEFQIYKVSADPARVWPLEDFQQPLQYVRLHGSPKVYYSSYTRSEITYHLQRMEAGSWCIFDNTASGAAAENALTMLEEARR